MKTSVDQDILLPFSFKNLNIKGRILRLNKTSKYLLERFSSSFHEVNKIFLDSLSLSQAIASNLKFEGVFKLQINCDQGILKSILCDTRNDGSMRAYMSLHDNYKLSNSNPDFRDIIGEGIMIFHLHMKDFKNPYQGIIDLSQKDLSFAAMSWFEKSEQIPTYIKLFSNVERKITGALFLQKIANHKDNKNDFETIKILSETLNEEEILNEPLEYVLYKLYNQFDVIVYDDYQLSYKCHCNESIINHFISSLSIQEVDDIKKHNNGVISITCSFCGKEYVE